MEEATAEEAMGVVASSAARAARAAAVVMGVVDAAAVVMRVVEAATGVESSQRRLRA